MRIGNNPEKEKNIIELDAYHRVVIPVYIPNLTDPYFKDGLKILKLCLESLLITVHVKTRISIINNNCSLEVSNYLQHLYKEYDEIDQLLNSKINLGKVNALYAAIKSNLEPIITIADSDVMFLTGWQKETEKILKDFPECGMVSPVPSIGSLKGAYLKSTLGFAHLKGKIRREKVINPSGIKNFLRSIGRNYSMDEEQLKYYTVTRNNKKAVIGCGHFFVSIRASVFEKSPKHPSNFKIVGGSEALYIDQPNDKCGYLKLATLDNYGYHLGNKYENWMQDAFNEVKKESKPLLNEQLNFKNYKPSLFYYAIGYIIQKLFYR